MLSVEQAKCLAMETLLHMIGPARIIARMHFIGVTWMDWGNPVYVMMEGASDGGGGTVVCMVDRRTGRVRVHWRH